MSANNRYIVRLEIEPLRLAIIESFPYNTDRDNNCSLLMYVGPGGLVEAPTTIILEMLVGLYEFQECTRMQ